MHYIRRPERIDGYGLFLLAIPLVFLLKKPVHQIRRAAPVVE